MKPRVGFEPTSFGVSAANEKSTVQRSIHLSYLSFNKSLFFQVVKISAVLHKIYGKAETGKYSPAECIGTKKTKVTGFPDKKHISTSYVERQNLTMRMHMRRFTRLTNAFSKKMENHCLAIALHFVYYNFCKVHKSLRVTPAMEAGLAKRPMTIEDLVNLTEGK